MPKKRNDQTGQAKYHTYVWLWMAGRRALEQAENPKGSTYNGMLAVLATALMLEAFLHHLAAEKKFNNWAVRERKMDHKKRLKAVAKEIGMPLDTASAQYVAFIEAFEVREQLVHGRTQTMVGSWQEDEQPTGSFSLKPLWLKASEGGRPHELFSHVEALIDSMYRHAGLKGRPLGTLTEGSSSSAYGAT